ncbi:uncharacterized protein METZ01_LOCUS231421 [marine metagenome]|uniref:Uncharacterized protein n=1 Tax=marine metagenome TaxID=408172 RepID=A0A382GV50_9ZZZZ
MPKVFNILPVNLIKKKNPLHCDVCDLIPDQAPDGEDNFLGGWGQTKFTNDSVALLIAEVGSG